MLCEFIARSAAAGLGTAERMQLPFTQEEIGDATGLTPVHVNRMLRSLEEEGLIQRQGRSVQVEDWARFQQAAGFDDAYLHAAA
jgi:CRP-like cAMP-binding protein